VSCSIIASLDAEVVELSGRLKVKVSFNFHVSKKGHPLFEPGFNLLEGAKADVCYGCAVVVIHPAE
jgi:hypothetical protein